MHGGDAQFNCSTSKKVVKFGQLPDHDILIDYGLIVNRLVVVDFFLGGRDHTPINRAASRIHL